MEDADIASYAEEKTPYVSADNIDEIIKSLGKVSKKFHLNISMKT